MKKLIIIPFLFMSLTALGQFTKPQLYSGINTEIRGKTASQSRLASMLDSLTKSFQVNLVSGTNIRTINGASLLGSGNITIAPGITGSGVTNELSYWVSSTVLGSLSTSTYPSLTELSYVKGVTSPIQAQIDAIQTYQSTPPEIIYAAITGQTMKGRVLSIPYFFRDIDGTAQGATTFQWVRANDAIGTGAVNISGATSSTYTLVTADVTKYITCKITPVNVTPETGSVYTAAYVGVVDDTYYPADNANTVVSYGIKKMAVAYAGFGIRVQLSSGGTTTDIGFDVNGDLDWAAVATAAGGGGGVIYLNRWYDQSTNGFTMTFATFAAQPQVDYLNKRIIWAPTKTGLVTHNSAMDIGTGDFSFFMEATQKILQDATFSFFTKQTSFSANNLQLYSPIGVGVQLYSGNASTNTMRANYSTPERRGVISAYRTSTNKFINTNGVITTAAEAATNLTSTNNINFNAGDGGAGDWLMWSFTMYKQNYGADYSKYTKFVSADN